MPAPIYTAADFLAGFQALLPTGPVWPRDADAVQTQVALALTGLYPGNAGRAANLLTDAFPVAPVELLPEWESTLGLPDPCAGPAPTLQVRQQQVNARFIAGGGQSVNYFVSVAAALGYQITITQFTPSRFGQPFGQPFAGEDWAFAWQVNAPTFSITHFTFGRDTFGEPFSSFGNTVLQCELQRLAPAHTTLLFSYS
ncbi:YmfQ family protein [Rhodopila sp.]|uniref:YmfQ family protein n=1 Tax=Rhodopila sp. TaxID=2480087 RepID=UPI003D11E7C7